MTTPTTTEIATAAEAQRARRDRTPYERCVLLVARIAEITGEAWTLGYIGNVELSRDDRAWFAFRPHPGRVGTSADRIGGYGTDDLAALVPVLQGAAAMARMSVR